MGKETPKTKTPLTRRGAAMALAMLALGGMAATGMAPAATAADGSHITLYAPAGRGLDGVKATVYKLGAYGVASDTDKDGTPDTIEVTDPDQATADWVKAALAAAKVTEDADYDQAGNLAKLGKDGDAATLRTIALALAGSTAKPTPVVDAQALSGSPATVDLPADGLYLVTFDAHTVPVIVGTQVGGKDLSGQAGMGAATVKLTDTTVDKKAKAKDGTWADQTTGMIGHDTDFQATIPIPTKGANPTKLTYQDTPTGMTYKEGSLKATIDGKDVTLPAPTVKDGGFSVDLKDLIDGNWDKAITLTYSMTITAEKAENGATVTTHDPATDTDVTTKDTPVPVTTYAIDLDKATTDGDKLNGAGFKIQQAGGAWLAWDPATGAWSDAADEAGATEFLTGDTNHDGQVSDADDTAKAGTIHLAGLDQGSYTVKETTTPAGMLSYVKPSMTVTIAPDGTVTTTDVSDPRLVTTDGTTITIRNIASISQLPLTGAFATGTMAAAGVLLVAGGATGCILAIRRLKDGRAIISTVRRDA